MEVLINRSYGSFKFSKTAIKYLCEKEHIKYNSYKEVTEGSGIDIFSPKDNPLIRIDKDAISCVKKLGHNANGQYVNIKIAKIPDNSSYLIDNDDSGREILYYSKSPISQYHWN